MYKLLAVVASCMILIACSPALIKPSIVDETRGKEKFEGVTLASLEKGHEIYTAKCGKCHKLYAPKSESEAEWKKILPIMGKKAKLTSDEYKLVEQYVFTMKDAVKK